LELPLGYKEFSMRYLFNLGLCLLIFLFSNTLSALSIGGLDLVSNKNVERLEEKSQVKVIIFLSSICPCSQAHFDHLNELQKTFSQFTFIGLQVGKGVSALEASAHYAKYKINFPIILDQDFKYADHFKAVKTPHVFIVDQDENLLFQGGATDSRHPSRAKAFYLRDALISISSNKQIKENNAKTLGCYIQR
jgi:hypothetical protein